MTNSAIRGHRERGDVSFRVSVFADVEQEGEDEDALLERLFAVAELQQIRVAPGTRYRIARARELPADLPFVKDDYPGEPVEHYSVDLGSDAGAVRAAADRLSAALQGPHRILGEDEVHEGDGPD